MTLNADEYTIRNILPQGMGWDLNAAGETTVVADAWTDTTMQANVQPHTLRMRTLDGQGFTTLDGIKAYIDTDLDGSWPDIHAGENLGRRLPTQIQFEGAWYEVVKVKDTWKHGLMPHIYVEAKELEMDMPTGPTSSEVELQVDGDTVTEELEW